MTTEMIRTLLLVEDNPGDARLLREILNEQDSHGIRIMHVESMGEAESSITVQAPDIILLDLGLPDAQGLDAVRRTRQVAPGVPMVVLTGNDDEELAAQALEAGAQDYLIKGEIEHRGLVRSLRYAVKRNFAEEALRSSEQRYRQLVQSLDVAIYTTDAEGRITLFNEAAADLWGRKPVLGQDLWCGSTQIYGPDGHVIPLEQCPMAVSIRDGKAVVGQEIIVGRNDGSRRDVLPHPTLIYDNAGNVTGAINMLLDITERKSIEDALFIEKERAEVTLQCIGDAVACTDCNGNITFINLVAETMTGWPLTRAMGRPMSDVFRIFDSSTPDTLADLMQPHDSNCEPVRLSANCLLLRPDGSHIPIEDSIAPIHDRQGKRTGTVVVLRDVTAVRAMSVEMAHSAEHDFLTGLPNRMLLNDRIGQAIALSPRHGKQVAVLFLDLDGFKHINDSLGHPVGDKLLQSVAARLMDCVRGSDTVSRQGGDEFVVLLSEAEQWNDAAIVAKRMLKAVMEPHSIDNRELHVTASIGVSVFPDDGADAETLIKNADTAMYQAKENGRHAYRFFKPEMNVRAVERQSIEEDLRRAIELQELALHYQPIVDMKTGMITGVEALMRWSHPVRGFVSPAQFIPVAEDCGLILPIGKWVLREACRQVKAWVSMGLPEITLAVNVSAVEFGAENFLDGIFEILAETCMDPRRLELELTESVLMKRVESTATILQQLRERGVKVSIDDFGTGYSSLSYLGKFPVDVLKIDQSFVRQISSDSENSTIVTAIINMARSLKLRVIAEGVETAEELNFLRQHKCEEAQGYFFSRPVPAEQVATLLKEGLLISDSFQFASSVSRPMRQNKPAVPSVPCRPGALIKEGSR
ncbi:MAG: EAL domain-containing protein [Candidatus Sumerlaeaceae bacterium]